MTRQVGMLQWHPIIIIIIIIIIIAQPQASSCNTKIIVFARNTLDCDQSNYSSRIVFSHIPIEFDQTGNSAIRSADSENHILEPNIRSKSDDPPRRYRHLKFSQMWGRSSVGPQYTSYTDLIHSSSLR